MIKTDSKALQIKELIKVGPCYIYILCNWFLYKKSIVVFDGRKYNNELNEKLLIKSFDDFLYLCKMCHKQHLKEYILCQAVSGKLEVFNLTVEFQSFDKFENVLILKCMLFMKVAIMPRGKMKKIRGTIFNIPVDNTDVTNLLPNIAGSIG